MDNKAPINDNETNIINITTLQIMDTTIIAACIAGLIAITVPVSIGIAKRIRRKKLLYLNLVSEDDKTRLSAIDNTIRYLQKTRDELRYLIESLNNNNYGNYTEAAKKCNAIRKQYDNSYARGMVVMKEEGRLIHAVKHDLHMLETRLEKYASRQAKGDKLEKDIPILLKSYREKLEIHQGGFRAIREELIRNIGS